MARKIVCDGDTCRIVDDGNLVNYKLAKLPKITNSTP